MRVDDLEELPAAPAQSVGHRFVAALAAKDAATLHALFGDQVDFRAMTPRRAWEAEDPGTVVSDVLFQWFAPNDIVERIESVRTGMIGGRHSLGYRLQVTNPDGRFLVEQQAFLDIADDKITWMRVLCSGYRPVAGDQAAHA